MFNKKLLTELKSELRKFKYCEECGVAVHNNKIKEVIVYRHLDGMIEEFEYYCDRHAPKYDKVVEATLIDKRFFWGNKEVDKNGKLIK